MQHLYRAADINRMGKAGITKKARAAGGKGREAKKPPKVPKGRSTKEPEVPVWTTSNVKQNFDVAIDDFHSDVVPLDSTALDFFEDDAGGTAIDELYDDEGPADDADSRGDAGDYGDVVDDFANLRKEVTPPCSIARRQEQTSEAEIRKRCTSALPIKRVLAPPTDGPQLMLEEEEED